MKKLKALTLPLLFSSSLAVAQNPLFTDVFTADPAALVHNDTVYLYTGHDEAPNNDVFFEMHDWLAFFINRYGELEKTRPNHESNRL